MKEYEQLDERFRKAGVPEEGWWPIISGLIEDLDGLLGAENWKPIQIKEKFGGLRFYVEFKVNESHVMEMTEEAYAHWKGEVDTAYKIIGLAEKASYNTCEMCGTEKDVKTEATQGWEKTLCDPCRVERYKNK